MLLQLGETLGAQANTLVAVNGNALIASANATSNLTNL